MLDTDIRTSRDNIIRIDFKVDFKIIHAYRKIDKCTKRFSEK